MRSIDTFFDSVLSEPVKIAVVGCGCSVASQPIAEILDQWNISQVLIHDYSYKNYVYLVCLDYPCP